jgi:hypothetical protein
MSMYTKELTAVNDKALAIVTLLHNDGLPADVTPLTPHEYLSQVLDGVLKSWQDQHVRIPASEFLLRFPAGKIDTIKAAAGNNPQLAAYIEELRANPWVYTGSTLVRTGIAMLVGAGLLTQAQADVILA